MSQRDWDAMVEEYGDDPVRLGPFGMGFATACLVGGFWWRVYVVKYPSPRGDVGVVIRESQGNRPVLVEKSMMIDPAYEGEIHITPDTAEGRVFSLGVHDFTLQCFCHPEVKQVHGCTLIVHSMRRI